MLFSSKRSAQKSQQVSDVLSISKDEVKTKLAELCEVTRQAECTFKEAAAMSKEVAEQITRSKRKKKPSLSIAS